MRRYLVSAALLTGMLAAGSPGGAALADPATFDLDGPALRVTVTRQGTSLPVGEVPQLAAGDKVEVNALLPADQSAHYVLVAAFLRGPTNPPPNGWFTRTSTWRQGRKDGGPLALTVPAGAQQLVLFLAPETGGDFKTLRGAVQGRPGAFVRAVQDLEQASLDRRRLDTYLAAIRAASDTSSENLAHMAPVLASSLRMKINADCLLRQPELQAACLLDNKEALVLGDGSSASGSTLTNAGTDLALSLSATPTGGLGYYSPYISAVREIIGIFGAMHTAKYQYIPALGVPRGDRLALVLNTVPSFSNPKSVLVAALPAVTPPAPPSIQLPTPAPTLCAQGGDQVLPLSASPLFYATAYARGLALRVSTPGGVVELPAVPDAAKGGVVVDAGAALPGDFSGIGTLHGQWGFGPFSGPAVALRGPGAWGWHAAPGAEAGHGEVALAGAPSACVTGVETVPAQGAPVALAWKAQGADGLAVTLLPQPHPGPVTLAILGPKGTVAAHVTLAPPAETQAPVARVIARNVEPAPPTPGLPMVQLTGPDEIPAGATFRFSLRLDGTDRFTTRDVVEVGTPGSETVARLGTSSGLTLVDPQVALASLQPGKALGASAFGPLRARVVRGGVAGDWLPLGTLVRLPRLTKLSCPGEAGAPCVLAGDDLFLLASVAAGSDFDKAISVPDGYPGVTLQVPHPGVGGLYVRLHDAPEMVNRLMAPGG